jgi:hypothetical protein
MKLNFSKQRTENPASPKQRKVGWNRWKESKFFMRALPLTISLSCAGVAFYFGYSEYKKHIISVTKPDIQEIEKKESKRNLLPTAQVMWIGGIIILLNTFRGFIEGRKSLNKKNEDQS